MSELIFRSRLFINQEKVRVDHPDITGSITVETQPYRVALWLHQTKDGEREYYSGTLQRDGDRSSPRYKLKLYEMRKVVPSDPDFHSPFPSQIGPYSLYGYLWIRPSRNSEIAIGLELREITRSQKLTEQAEEFRAHLHSKFNGESHNELGEPTDINF